METLLFAFANQQSNPLPTLQEEDTVLNRTFASHVKANHFLVRRESFVTLDDLYENLILFRHQLVVFLFSGHAGRDRLELGDGTARGAGIAQMLGECSKLKLVFLNGCSTEGQVETLLSEGIPVVIASSAPVEDDKATFFSIQFFRALEQQASIKEAFTLAKGMLEAKYNGISPEIRVFKGAGFSESETPVWALCYEERNEYLLDWRLSNTPADSAQSPSFTPNELLITGLFEAFEPYNDVVREMAQNERRGESISLTRKRMVVWHTLPPLLAEPIRKLLATVNEENKGYDKISEARVQRIVRAYETGVELIAFMLLAQIWDEFYSETPLELSLEQKTGLNTLMHVSATERQVLDLIPLIRLCIEILKKNKTDFFIPELSQLLDLFQEEKVPNKALNSLHRLRLQANSANLNQSTLEDSCRLGEENLVRFYSRLCFLTQYKLAAVNDIDVLKFKHKQQISFKHNLVKLEEMLGEYERWSANNDLPLDNYSTLIWQKEWNCLNLSPFVIDENTWQQHPDGKKRNEMCNMYFYSHYDAKANMYFYKYVKNPEYPYLEVSAASYPLIWEQLQAFAALLNP